MTLTQELTRLDRAVDAATNRLLEAAGSNAEPAAKYKLYDPPEFEALLDTEREIASSLLLYGGKTEKVDDLQRFVAHQALLPMHEGQR